MRNGIGLIFSALAALCLVSGGAPAAERTRGYVKKDGTYVAPHMKTSPDSSKFNNYSTQGNVNPYTGKQGTKNPYR